MTQLSYAAVLVAILVGSLWLEAVLKVGVLRRWRRLLLTVLPVAGVFLLWDAYAVSAGHWSFDPGRVVGVWLGEIPLEEALFFLTVPLAAILTFEAVRAVRGWRAGDER